MRNLYKPKKPINIFAGDAAKQKAEQLAMSRNAVIVSQDSYRGIRPAYAVYYYQDIVGSDRNRIVADYSDMLYQDIGAIEISLPQINGVLGKVIARAVCTDAAWQENIDDSLYRIDIIRSITYSDLYDFDKFELDWWQVPPESRKELILAGKENFNV